MSMDSHTELLSKSDEYELNEDFSDSVGREAERQADRLCTIWGPGTARRLRFEFIRAMRPLSLFLSMVPEKSKGAITGTLQAVTKIF